MPPVAREPLPYRPDSEYLFNVIRGLPDPVWLDSGKPRSEQGRYDILSACPDAILETTGATSRLVMGDGLPGSTLSGLTLSGSTGDPFQLAGRLLRPLLLPANRDDLPFAGGLIGYFGYDLGRRLIDLPDSTRRLLSLPDLRLGRYLWALVVDHEQQQSQLVFHSLCPNRLKQTILRRLQRCREAKRRDGDFRLLEPFSPSRPREHYLRAVSRIKDYIRAGDCYQVNFSQHFSARFSGDPWPAYCALRQSAPSPYSAFLQWQGARRRDAGPRRYALLSLSPERFIRTRGGLAETKPVKGTIRRGATPEQDSLLARRLLDSNKDRAENLMIVDLLRNDLGKGCRPGSIRVPKLFALESFANVHHLVSTITGELADNATPLGLLRHAFPGGSITGAPKKRAMEIIEELETIKRSAYCGSIGYISANKRMDTNIAIRSLAADTGALHCWGGGGIVADSDPDREYQESLDKIRVLLATLEQFGRRI